MDLTCQTHEEVSGNCTRSALLEQDRQARPVPGQAVGQPVLKWTAIFLAQRDHHAANGAPEMSACLGGVGRIFILPAPLGLGPRLCPLTNPQN